MSRRMRIDRPSEVEAAREHPPHFDAALNMLLRAWQQAQQAGSSVWEYAVEIQDVRAVDVPTNTLRWLVDIGYVQHAFEKTARRSKRRRFERHKTHAFTNRSCFVLTDCGVAFARGATSTPAHGASHEDPPHVAAVKGLRRDVPHWDPSGRVRMLLLGDIIVMVFTRAAPDREAVLAAFQTLGWPPEIDDPLPAIHGKKSKTRHHNTIKRLNEGQTVKLIRFYSADRGQRIGWRLVG